MNMKEKKIKKILTDKKISIEAKSIYIYILLYQEKEYEIPSPDEISSNLNIGEDRYYTHRKQLEENNYLIVEVKKSFLNRYNYIIL